MGSTATCQRADATARNTMLQAAYNYAVALVTITVTRSDQMPWSNWTAYLQNVIDGGQITCDTLDSLEQIDAAVQSSNIMAGLDASVSDLNSARFTYQMLTYAPPSVPSGAPPLPNLPSPTPVASSTVLPTSDNGGMLVVPAAQSFAPIVPTKPPIGKFALVGVFALAAASAGVYVWKRLRG